VLCHILLCNRARGEDEDVDVEQDTEQRGVKGGCRGGCECEPKGDSFDYEDELEEEGE
jgi:hypothetical protein